MKKLVSCLLALLTITSLSVSVFAEEYPIEVGPHPGMSNTNMQTYDESNFEDKINEMVETHRQTYKPTSGDYERAYYIIDAYKSIALNSNGASTLSSFDDNWWQLRYGNLIEFTLDTGEGVSLGDATAAFQLSRRAEDLASSNFSAYKDSAQHFLWNFLMTHEYGKSVARTIGNNHEWGIAMIDPMLNHFESAYDDYISAGYSENDASNKALADTIVYMPIFKDDAIFIMQSSFDFFDTFFSDESIMDLWNNCYGRAYPEKGYNEDEAVQAFRYSAFTAKELVLDGEPMAANLTNDHKHSVWSWDWYSY